MAATMNVGLWGCGGMGRSLAQALAAAGEARLAVVYDLNPNATPELAAAHGAQVADSAEALLAYPGLDGVIIALPPDLHAPAAIQAAAAGVDIFLEKPMSVNVAGCRQILQAVQRCGVKLMIGHVLRYYEPYRAIRRWLAEGRFGRLNAAVIWRVIDGRHIDAAHWRASQARSGGYLFEVGIHELDMQRCLLGRPQTVSAVAQKTCAQGGEWSDFIAVQVRFGDGGAATYEGGVGSYVGRYGFRLYFDEATLLSDAAFDRSALRVYGPGGQEIETAAAEFSSEHPVEAELRAWLAALRDEAPVAIPGEEGMASVALAQTAYRAAESRQTERYEI